MEQKISLHLGVLYATQDIFKDKADKDQNAHNVQSDLNLYSPIKRYSTHPSSPPPKKNFLE